MTDLAPLAYDRAVLVNVLVYHWRTNTSGCGCGWTNLGASHPEHVADVYEKSARHQALMAAPIVGEAGPELGIPRRADD